MTENRRIDLDPGVFRDDYCQHVIGYYEDPDDAYPIFCGYPKGHTGPHREPEDNEL